MRNRIKRSPEWSKALTLLILAPFFGVTVLAARLSHALFETGAPSDSVALMQALLAFVAAPTAVALGFYFWKARAENMVKIAKQMQRDEICDDIARDILNKGE